MATTPDIIHNVPVRLGGGRDYDIDIGTGLIRNLGTAVRDVRPNAQALVVMDKNTAALFGDAAMASFKRARMTAHEAVVPAGERSKNLTQYRKLLLQITSFDDARDVVVVALGGGVVGDLAGFVASSYKRGVPFVQVPTTLLACVDSSVGGKTGLDLPAGKNLVGAFWQPARVIMDLGLLRDLPPRELRAGYAEALKTALIFEKKFFAWLERNVEDVLSVRPAAMAHVVKRCCELKARVVRADERDSKGARALLNFGHTFGHAAEAALSYQRLRHGEAVSVGMLCAADLSCGRGFISADDVARIESHMADAGLPQKFPACDPDSIFEHIKYDKKFVGGKMRLVLLEKLGRAALFDDVKAAQIRKAIKSRTAK